jgi:phage baseplate assembly protein gpV
MSERNTRIRKSQISDIAPKDVNAYATNEYVDGYVPSYDSATGKWTWIENAGGVSTLSGLSDVDFDSGTPTDGQVLTYDSSSDRWKAEDASGGESELSELTDVDFDSGTPTDNQILQYDSTTDKWKAEEIDEIPRWRLWFNA